LNVDIEIQQTLDIYYTRRTSADGLLEGLTADVLREEAVVLLDAHQNTSPIRVLLVDDHVMIRQGLRCALECYPCIEVVDEAGDGEEAVACVAKVLPAVVVIDIVMPKMDGIAATRRIKTQYPQIAVIGLTRDLKDYTFYSMKKAGAFEILDKKSGVVELYEAIQRAVGGIDGKAVKRLEIGPGLGSMTEAT
jgi:CheY-like chemotaxis protein